MACKTCGEEMKMSHTTKTNVTIWVCSSGGWNHDWRCFWNNKWAAQEAGDKA